ncbi:MAG: hypothetical protein HUU54_08720 [Ignavibacteriaceae bacterium]|nr:hypothetical protein [Ignavibacteriaceae bacterium]
MSFRDQQKLIDELKSFERVMTPQDKDEYKMFIKRQKDDEDFDTVSMAKLKALHSRYYKTKNKSDFDKFFKPKTENQ